MDASKEDEIYGNSGGLKKNDGNNRLIYAEV
jgi:hypothetical protein